MMINLGALNSRMKDFFDIWRLMQHGFDGEALYNAVSQTIISRSTEVILFSELEKELNESPENNYSGLLFWETHKFLRQKDLTYYYRKFRLLLRRY